MMTLGSLESVMGGNPWPPGGSCYARPVRTGKTMAPGGVKRKAQEKARRKAARKARR